MKIKFWQFENEFDRDDAKIVIPIILLLIALSFGFSPLWLLAAAVAYYLLLFFSDTGLSAVPAFKARRRMRCPHCRNRKIFLQGYQGYKSDEMYAYYFAMIAKLLRS
jgi:hypothetical protein